MDQHFPMCKKGINMKKMKASASFLQISGICDVWRSNLNSRSKYVIFQHTVTIMCLLMLPVVFSFNIDTESLRVYRPPRLSTGENVSSFFGFSVEMVFNSEGTWILVGAPKSNSTVYPSSITQPGALYKCSIDENVCQEVEIDKEGNTCCPLPGQIPCNLPSGDVCTISVHETSYWNRKDYQWLGASIAVKQDDLLGKITVCAPKWVDQIRTQGGTSRANLDYYMTGQCWELNGEMEFAKRRLLYPLTGSSNMILPVAGKFKFGLGMAGWNVHYAEGDDNILFIGAPGENEFCGTIVTYDASRTLDPDDIPTVTNFQKGSGFIDSYMGYAVKSGNFFSDGVSLIVAGAPRYDMSTNTGAVFVLEVRKNIFTKSPEFVIKVTKLGETMGEYFGAAVEAADVNNDGVDDLIVGAPLYSGDESGTVEQGRVYVFVNEGAGDDPLNLQLTLEGNKNNRARFGTALNVVGDLNLDGFPDLVIGAPYEDNGQGAVYVYRGSSDGIKSEHAQRIGAADTSELTGGNLYGMGWSISTSMDVDSNFYPDFAVGAYESDAAILFFTRPVIQASATLSFEPSKINVNDAECSSIGGAKVACATASVCLNYTGKHVPTVRDFAVLLKITHEVAKRAYFYVEEMAKNEVSYNASVLSDKHHCSSIELHVNPEIKDILQPISFELTYGLIEEPIKHRARRQTSNDLSPVLSVVVETVIQTQLAFSLQCGADEMCISDLSVGAVHTLRGAPEEYIIPGKHDILLLTILLQNRGENAYQAKVSASYSQDLLFTHATSLDQNYLVLCSAASLDKEEKEQVTCEVANPLPANTKTKFQLEMDCTALSGDKNITIELTASTTSEESQTGDNVLLYNVSVQREADVQLRSSSRPEQLIYNSTTISGEDKAFSLRNYTNEFIHTYEVYNQGPSLVNSSTLTIRFPYKTQQDDELTIFIKEFEIQPFNYSLSCNDSSYLKPLPDEATRDLTVASKILDNTVLNCTTVKCVTFTCTVAPLAASYNAFVRISARLNETVLLQLGLNAKAHLVSEARVIVTDDVKQSGSETGFITTSTTLVTETSTEILEPVEPWIIGVSAVTGILLLIILVLVLIKCGFFNRKKKTELESMRQSVKSKQSYGSDSSQKETRPLSLYADVKEAGD